MLGDEDRAFLEGARRAFLATSGATGAPHAIPVCFALLDPSTVVFAIDDRPKRPGRRLERLSNLGANPRFALIVDRWDEDWAGLAWLLLRGVAVACTDPGRRVAAITALRARYPQYVVMDLDAQRHEVIELRVESVRRWSGAGHDGIATAD